MFIFVLDQLPKVIAKSGTNNYIKITRYLSLSHDYYTAKDTLSFSIIIHSRHDHTGLISPHGAILMRTHRRGQWGQNEPTNLKPWQDAESQHHLQIAVKLGRSCE